MKLGNFYIKLEGSRFSVDQKYSFLLRSRFICNFLERAVLRKLDVEVGDFSQVCIVFRESDFREPFVNAARILCIDVPFDARRHNDLSGKSEFGEFYCAGIAAAVERLKQGHRDGFPSKQIIMGLEKLRELGFDNSWIHQTKLLKSFGARADLRCELSVDCFKLILIVKRGEGIVFERLIFETEPDENAFEYRIGNIKCVNGVLSVSDRKLNKPFVELCLSEIGAMGSGDES